MSEQENLNLIHKMYDALNAKDLDAHDRYWSPNMVWHGPPAFGDIHGLENFKNQVMRPFYKAFPDYYAKNDIEVAGANWVAATGYLTGTHSAEFLGVPATGRAIRMRFSDFWLIENGMLTHNYVMTDDLDLLRQMGIDVLKMVRPK